MITRLAEWLTYELFSNAIIEEDDIELYTYGSFILISHKFFFCVTVLLGVIFNTTWENIVFYFFFTLIRSYAGGVHARKEITCIFCTIFAFIISTIGISWMNTIEGNVLQAVCIILGTLVIVSLCPLDTAEKPLDADERHCYKIISYVITGAIDTIAMISCAVNHNGIYNAATVSILLESILLIAGEIERKHTDKNESNSIILH